MSFGAAVYGSLLVASVVGIAYEAGQSAATMTATAASSMVVFWAAHTWSEALGERVAAGPAFRRRDILVVARHEWPLVEAAVLPTLCLALAWAGAWSREAGTRAALGAALLQIVGWGIVAGLRSGASPIAAAVMGAGEGALGLALLALERFVH